MSRIYKRSDRIPVKIGDIIVKVAPLTFDQKAEIQHAMLVGRSKGDIKEATRGVVLALKYAIKSIEGLIDSDNKPYVLTYEGENLSDECISDLMNLPMSEKLVYICSTLVQRIPDEFTDTSGNKLEGVEILKESKPEKNV